MFPTFFWSGDELSLMPASEFPQKEVGVVARMTDVVEDGCTAQFTCIIDDDIAEPEDALEYRSRHSNVLHLA